MATGMHDALDSAEQLTAASLYLHGPAPSGQMFTTTYTESRSSTPEASHRRPYDEKSTSSSSESEAGPGAAGRLPEEVYERTLNLWRNRIRGALSREVEWESEWLAAMQERIRHPFLDAYFVYTSSLGTHTFFMIMLPALFFFGYEEIAQGLIMVLALGVYASSLLKDLFCSPRPFAPPVTRLTIGNHHLEYGFPSTHSTNSVSIALFFFTILRRLSTTPVITDASTTGALGTSANLTALQNAAVDTALGVIDVREAMISSTTYYVLSGVLLFYVFSIVYGRLYTGMHSFTDCTVGVLLGVGIWAANLMYSDLLHAWIRDSGWVVPAVTVPLGLFMVHRHPQPVDDCPCFEDAIAFVSVVMGEVNSRWYMLHNGYDARFFVCIMPGSSWATWMDVFTWCSVGAIKLILGILVIFVWRILAKAASHMVLPPVFRLLAQLVTLPHRRFYTPATDYTNVPAEKTLHPIPSVIDLPGMLEREEEREGASSSSRPTRADGMKLRGGGRRGERALGDGEKGAARGRVGLWLEETGGKSEEQAPVVHYDADVLTKVVVYCGIGMLAGGFIPVMFEVLGWGVKIL